MMFDGKISLVDFGGVLDASREQGGSTIVGTYGYMAPEQLHGQVTAATDIYALGATIVAIAGGIEPENVPRKGLRMDLDRHLPSLDAGLRAALTAMTDPDPDKRPQRARDVVALLAKSRPPRARSDERDERAERQPRALAVQPPNTLARRNLFSDVPEPLGTLLRLSVLSFGAGGWVGMAGIRLSLAIVIYTFAALAFPARRKMIGVGGEIDAMLAEGQGGFADMMKGAMARTSRRA
jgi:serine/threonine protein kinase